MNALTLDDLLPLEEFAGRRREFLEAHGRYLDRYRRVRIGPAAALLFMNRQTLWFQLQDVLRIARLAAPGRVQRELDIYNRLLPGRDRLQAALLLTVDETRLTEELAPWRDLHGGDLRLCLGPAQLPANLLTCRPEDQCIGAAHWVQFVVDTTARRLLADFRRAAYFAVTRPHYSHESAPLSEDVRRSLLEDLEASDRNPAA
ncbi:MAG TPA: DUF3501 family protein [Gemmataceae bacterium]|nr:DUF3501 family protein [Gemmataceae bacterium]